MAIRNRHQLITSSEIIMIDRASIKMAAAEAVLKYLASANRPYSANDIVSNMHKEFGKAAVQKALDELVSQGSVLEKCYGKQKIYCVKQPEETDKADSELQELEAEVQTVTKKLKDVEKEAREAEITLRDLLATPTTEDAKTQLAEAEERVAALRARLERLTSGTVTVPPEERKKIKADHESALREYRKRKRICMDIVNAILEGYPKSKRELMEEVGIETDEDAEMQPVIQS